MSISNMKMTDITHVTASGLETNISYLNGLWSSTTAALNSSRDALYDFLGATYELSKRIALDEAMKIQLQDHVRVLYTSDRQKNSVKNKSVDELLLAAAMGIDAASLRSKYKKILLNASKAAIDPDIESFKAWLKETGGIVNALLGAVQAMKPASKTTSPSMPVKSLEADLISQYPSLPKENRVFPRHYDGFTVVLYYTEPGTNDAAEVSVIADRTLVVSAVRIAHKDIPRLHGSVDSAA